MKLTYRGIAQMCSFAGYNGRPVWEGMLWPGKAYDDLPVDNPHVKTLIAAGVLIASTAPDVIDEGCPAPKKVKKEPSHG